MTAHYPRLTQLLTLGLHLRETQSGPIMLREPLENVYVYPFFAKKLRRLSTPAEYIRKFAEACVIPIILYCSPAIFPGLLKQDFALLRRSIKFISNVCGLSFSPLTNLVCEHHIKASSDFAERILADSEHPLHEELSKARSHTSTRSRFKLLPSKTAAYRNSVLPALSRLLVDRNAELNFYLPLSFLEVYPPLPLLSPTRIGKIHECYHVY